MEKPTTRSVTAGLVRWVLINSISFITGTGLKKCIPSTCSGRDVPMATSMMGMDEVLVAMTAASSSSRSRWPNTSSLVGSASGTASTTRSLPATSSMSAVQAMRPKAD